jgi:hypothetical protein
VKKTSKENQMKKIVGLIVAVFVSLAGGAQGKPADTVVVALAKTSKMVLTVKDRTDLALLKQYDFQALFNDILTKLEATDTVKIAMVVDTPKTEVVPTEPELITWDDDDDDNDRDEDVQRKYRHHRTRHSINFDFGTNNYLEGGEFPDANGAQYAVRPWGSWYVGINSVLRTQVSNSFFIEFGAGVSRYDFKFQDDQTTIIQDDNGIVFSQDTRDASFNKSKLSVVYINASLIPMFDVGGYSRKARFWSSRNSAFRIGAGPYVGYRIASHTKIVYKEDGDKEKDKDHDNFYLNNMRYGVRLQLGVRSADFFFNYDLNELFATNKGPKLNAFSFGVIF